MIDFLNSLEYNGDLSILVHEYGDFDKTQTSKEMKDTIIKKWERIGFLSGLDGENKDRVAVAYEQIATFLLQDKNEYSKSVLATLSFPMVRRVICGSMSNEENYVPKEKFSIKKFIKVLTDTDKYHTNLDEWVDKVNEFGRGMREFDSEAEATVIICEAIIDWMNNDDVDFNEIIKNKFEAFKEKNG